MLRRVRLLHLIQHPNNKQAARKIYSSKSDPDDNDEYVELLWDLISDISSDGFALMTEYGDGNHDERPSNDKTTQLKSDYDFLVDVFEESLLNVDVDSETSVSGQLLESETEEEEEDDEDGAVVSQMAVTRSAGRRDGTVTEAITGPMTHENKESVTAAINGRITRTRQRAVGQYIDGRDDDQGYNDDDDDDGAGDYGHGVPNGGGNEIFASNRPTW